MPPLPPQSRTFRRNEGVALITALAMLLIFTILGTAYVGFMSIEQDNARYEGQQVHARHLARGGLHAAIGEIQAALQAGNRPQEEYEFQIPVYLRVAGALTAHPQTVHVSVLDESGRINVNHAPRQVLEALGFDRRIVRKLKGGLPAPGEPSTSDRRWLASVHELRSRGFLGAKAFKALDKDILTVYTVEDPGNPTGFINLNSAPAPVLAAVFNISPEEAETLTHARPFSSWEDAVAKTGRDPGTYNVQPSLQAPRAMPAELALDSKCYRLVSSAARVKTRGTQGHHSRAVVEAVVIIKGSGDYEFRFWSEVPGEEAPDLDSSVEQEAAEDEPKPELEAKEQTEAAGGTPVETESTGPKRAVTPGPTGSG